MIKAEDAVSVCSSKGCQRPPLEDNNRCEHHSLAEIAERFGCSRATVWNVLQARESSLPDSPAEIEVPT